MRRGRDASFFSWKDFFCSLEGRKKIKIAITHSQSLYLASDYSIPFLPLKQTNKNKKQIPTTPVPSPSLHLTLLPGSSNQFHSQLI
jgi:hypothetical protein